MSKLSAQERKALPAGDFALPGGRYPIEDAGHQQAALSMVSRYGTPEEQAKVRAAVMAKRRVGSLKDALVQRLSGVGSGVGSAGRNA